MSKQPPKKPTNEPETPNAIGPGTLAQPEGDAPKVDVLPRSESSFTADEAQSLGDADLNETLKTLRAEVRRRESAREAQRPRAGSKVRILRGRPKYVGKVGTAIIVRRSRCFVAVPEISSPAYALISDLELVER